MLNALFYITMGAACASAILGLCWLEYIRRISVTTSDPEQYAQAIREMVAEMDCASLYVTALAVRQRAYVLLKGGQNPIWFWVLARMFSGLTKLPEPPTWIPREPGK